MRGETITRKIAGLLTVAALVAFCFLGWEEASAELINPGFETGTTAGWVETIPAGGSISVVSAWQAFGGEWFDPVGGSYFANLKTDGPGSQTMLTQSVVLGVGEALKGWAGFDSRDFLPFNDGAAVNILDSLNNIIATPWSADVATVGGTTSSPWTEWTWEAIAAGTYTLRYEVWNGLDDTLDSRALFDVSSPVPEPGSLMLLGSGLMGLALWRKRRTGKS